MDSTKTLTVDVINARRILRFCPYYDDIINYDIRYDDEFSFDLIDWYKDLIFSCDGNNDNEMNIVRLIDKSMYLYINSYEYRNGLKRIVNIMDIDLNSDKRIKRLIKKIINYTNKYETMEVLNVRTNRWI